MTKFKPILAEKMNLSAFNAPIKRGMQNTQKRITEDYEAGTSTWRHRVTFDKKLSTSNVTSKASVTTDDPIYGFVHDGTRPHIIRPRRAKALAFGANYTAKTRPNAIRAGSGGSSGGTVFSKGVPHPGITPRNFTPVIAKNQQPLFAKEMQDRFKEAVKKSGHEI